METIDIKGKTINIVQPNGNICMIITVNEQGEITGGINCEVSIHNNNVSVKQLDKIL